MQSRVHSSFFFARSTDPPSREEGGDGKRDILLGWPK